MDKVTVEFFDIKIEIGWFCRMCPWMFEGECTWQEGDFYRLEIFIKEETGLNLREIMRSVIEEVPILKEAERVSLVIEAPESLELRELNDVYTMFHKYVPDDKETLAGVYCLSEKKTRVYIMQLIRFHGTS